MKQLLVAVSAILIIYGCSSSIASKPNNQQQNKVTEEEVAAGTGNIITFRVNGSEVKTSGWNIQRFAWKTSQKVQLNITTNMHDHKRTVNVNLNGAAAGTYIINENGAMSKQSYGSYFPDYAEDMMQPYSFADGTFILSEVDTINNIINGVFWGTVKNRKGETLTITDGKIISGKLSSGITVY